MLAAVFRIWSHRILILIQEVCWIRIQELCWIRVQELCWIRVQAAVEFGYNPYPGPDQGFL
jgi:hypothetical protein